MVRNFVFCWNIFPLPSAEEVGRDMTSSGDVSIQYATMMSVMRIDHANPHEERERTHAVSMGATILTARDERTSRDEWKTRVCGVSKEEEEESLDEDLDVVCR
jgi:hypothetical protein